MEVEVSIDDIRIELEDSPETLADALRILNRCGAVMKSIDDKIIKDMKAGQRKTIYEFFTDQAARYSKQDTGASSV